MRAFDARMRALRGHIRDCPSANTSGKINMPFPGMRRRGIPPLNTNTDAAAMVRNGSDIGATIVNITAGVNAWGHKIFQGIANAIQTVKNTSKVIENLKNINVKQVMKAMTEWVAQKSKQVRQWCKDIPTKAIVFVVVPLICVGVTLPILGAIGFGSAGIVAGKCLLLFIPPRR